MEIESHEIKHGRKVLKLSINHDRGTATVRFGTREPTLFHRRKPQETTTVFLRADEILQSTAEKQGTPFVLQFDTANSRLKAWAKARQTELGFDSVEPQNEDAYRITVTKTYSHT